MGEKRRRGRPKTDDVEDWMTAAEFIMTSKRRALGPSKAKRSVYCRSKSAYKVPLRFALRHAVYVRNT